MEFRGFPKIPRLSRECIVTEKIDGTNASVWISDDGSEIRAAKRSQFMTVSNDNYGFARWVDEHREELLGLGPGAHFGEWWGAGIQRGYGQKEKHFSLFNTLRWGDDRDLIKYPTPRPECCRAVPVLYRGLFDSFLIDEALNMLKLTGSRAAPGFMNPEGIVVYHVAGGYLFKKTFDDTPKGGPQ